MYILQLHFFDIVIYIVHVHFLIENIHVQLDNFSTLRLLELFAFAK